jgi:hypothetical protein
MPKKTASQRSSAQITSQSLANVPHVPNINTYFNTQQNFEQRAMGQHTTLEDMDAYCDQWQIDFDHLAK